MVLSKKNGFHKKDWFTLKDYLPQKKSFSLKGKTFTEKNDFH